MAIAVTREAARRGGISRMDALMCGKNPVRKGKLSLRMVLPFQTDPDGRLSSWKALHSRLTTGYILLCLLSCSLALFAPLSRSFSRSLSLFLSPSGCHETHTFYALDPWTSSARKIKISSILAIPRGCLHFLTVSVSSTLAQSVH